MMNVRDASGRQVSLLNDDSVKSERPLVLQRPASFATANHVLSQPYSSMRRNSSSPNTPELSRSDSYDSQTSTEAISPLTPSLDYTYPPRPPLYALNSDYAHDGKLGKRPSYAETSRSNSYEEDTTVTSPLPERPGKRYPCRYRESHGCEKTFTTSGHASRHSKIHTAEKAVQCTFAGCQKKFTRADNMKQHLETHYKDKSRISSQRAHKAALVEARRNTNGARPQETEQYALPTPPLASPTGTTGCWDVRGMNLPLLSRPTAARTPSSGLDALAMVASCQDGERA